MALGRDSTEEGAVKAIEVGYWGLAQLLGEEMAERYGTSEAFDLATPRRSVTARDGGCPSSAYLLVDSPAPPLHDRASLELLRRPPRVRAPQSSG